MPETVYTDSAPAGARNAAAPATPLRVLLVDDSVNDVMLARSLLQGHQRPLIEVVHCDNAEQAEQMALRGRSGFSVVLHGIRDAEPRYRRHLRNMIAALGACPLIVSGEFWDEGEIDMLAELGVQAVLPKTAWTEESLAHALLLAAAQGRSAQATGHDQLTGLPTRARWNDRLQYALDQCRRHDIGFAVMLVDIDHFKAVNDTLGHEAGDLYLREVAARLRGALRSEDMVARLGGDEFALLVHELPYPEAALSVAHKLIERCAQPMQLARATLSASVSIGVAVVSARQRRLTSDWVYQAADAALYQVKRNGRNGYSVYTDDMDREQREGLQVENDLSQAAHNGEFQLHYQPIFCAREHCLRGFEALLRWDKGGRRRLSPALFVPMLERLGLMHELGNAIFDDALLQLSTWRAASGLQLSMHINLSGVQLIQRGLGARLASTLERCSLPPSALVLELPEALLLQHGQGIERELGPLRAQGLKLAIDDFGTVHNAFITLRKMLPDMVKIDRRLVRRLEDSQLDVAIVRAQSVLARRMGIAVVAEGIETAHQLNVLTKAVDIDLLQGFLIGKSLPATDVEAAFPQLAGAASSNRHLRSVVTPMDAGG